MSVPGRSRCSPACMEIGKDYPHLASACDRGKGVECWRGARSAPACASVVVSEEFRAERWNERHSRLAFGPTDCFLCRPFVSHPALADSLELIEYLKEAGGKRARHRSGNHRSVVLFPAGQRGVSARDVARCATAALRVLARQGVAGVLLVHHRRGRRATTEGMLSRGSGLLSLSVDILIEMYRARQDDINDRRRRLIAFSRESATPGSVAHRTQPGRASITAWWTMSRTLVISCRTGLPFS